MTIKPAIWVFILGCTAISWVGCAPDIAENELVVLTASDSSFAEVLFALHRLDADLYEKIVRENDGIIPLEPQFTDTHKRDSVLAHFGLTSSEFDAKIEAHLKDPLRFQTIYNFVVDSAVRQ